MAIKTFTAGSVLTASDTNTYLANSGLVYVTSVTVGSGVTGVNVSSVFSSTYSNYLISYENIDSSVDGTGILFRFGTIASPVSTNYKFGGTLTNYATNTTSTTSANNWNNWEVAGTNTSNTAGQFWVNAPNLATPSNFTSQIVRNDISLQIAGIQTDLTQHTSFHLFPLSGTLTGGTITVFGVRKA